MLAGKLYFHGTGVSSAHRTVFLAWTNITLVRRTIFLSSLTLNQTCLAASILCSCSHPKPLRPVLSRRCRTERRQSDDAVVSSCSFLVITNRSIFLLQIAAAHKNSSQPAVTSTGNSLISGLLCCCLPHIFYWFLPVQCIDMMLECEKRRDCCGDRTTEDERERVRVC